MGRVMFLLALWSGLGLIPLAALAQPDTLPDFQTCMDVEIAGFEQDLSRLMETPADERDFDIGDVRGVDYCGTVGIVRCDRSDAPIPCQQALTVEQEALHKRVLALLPEPDAPTAPDAPFAKRLYASVWALAHGSSAGPDCAGMPLQLETWCATREANRRVQTSVLAWQAARYLGLAEPAVSAGWARPPPPTRPRQRPEGLR